jgi:hypothetical protein
MAMETNMAQELYVVIENSVLGDEIIGIFASMAEARAALPAENVPRLIDNFRIELHVLDEPCQEEAWRVTISKDGRDIAVSRFILCNCEDDAEALARGSFIEEGGERMQLVVWARSKGSALLAAERHRLGLLERGIWDTARVPLPPVVAQEL